MNDKPPPERDEVNAERRAFRMVPPPSADGYAVAPRPMPHAAVMIFGGYGIYAYLCPGASRPGGRVKH